MQARHLRNAAMVFALVAAVGLSACRNDSVGIDDDLDHGVERIRLVVNSQIVAEFDGTSWTGELDVTAGTSTDRIGVRLVDHDGALVTPPSGIHLQVDITNGAIAQWASQHSLSEFGGQLQGVAVGETAAVFKLMRGTKVEYATGAVDVNVNTP